MNAVPRAALLRFHHLVLFRWSEVILGVLSRRMNTPGTRRVYIYKWLGNLLKRKGVRDSAMVANLLIEQSDRYWSTHLG